MASDEGIEKTAPNSALLAHQPQLRGKVQ